MGRPNIEAIIERAAARRVLRLDGDNIEAAADLAALLAYVRELEADVELLQRTQREREACIDRLNRLLAERDRLARTLACERGEWAPEGWVYSFSQGQWMHFADPFAKVWRNGWMRRPNGSGYVAWGWEVWLEGERVEGYAPTALDAIEAAETALREVAGG